MTLGDRTSDLYRQYGPIIHRRCKAILEDEMGAEDATQETFQRVHKHLATVPEGREGLFWIYRVATNYCLNEIRNRKLRPTATDPAITDAFSIDDASVFENRTAVRQLINRAAPKLRSVA